MQRQFALARRGSVGRGEAPSGHGAWSATYHRCSAISAPNGPIELFLRRGSVLPKGPATSEI